MPLTSDKLTSRKNRDPTWKRAIPAWWAGGTLPTLNLLGVMTAWIIGSTIIVETVYAVPGLGRLLVSSLLGRDYFQNPYDSLNPRMSAGEMVAEPLIRHKLVPPGEVASRVSRLLDMVELPHDLAYRKPGQLSGGQCQRVGLARALAMNPRFLIADEITSALDVTTQAQILDLLERLQHEHGLGMLYISHDLSVVGSICQRVYVFRNGRIVETGPAAEVMTRPRESYTIQLVSSVPRFAAAAAT